MAARPAQIRSSRPPAARPAAPKRKDDLPITESLLFPRIHYHQCPACERVSGTGSGRGPGGGRARRRRAAQGPARPRRRSAPPRHWRRRSRAIPSVRTTLTLSSDRLRPGSGEPGEGAPRCVRLGPPRSDCLLRLCLLPLRRRYPSSPRRRRVLLRRRRLLLLPPPPLVPPLPLHQLHPGNSAAAAFGNPRHFPPRSSSPTLARSGTPPSANLGSPRPSSSSAAWLASSRPVRSFRSPLRARTRASGRRPSTLGVVRLGEPPEAGPGGPGARGAGGAFGRRPVGRARSHRGLNKGGCAAARAPGGAGRGGVPQERAGRRPRPCGLRPGSPWLGGGRTLAQAPAPRAGTRAAPEARAAAWGGQGAPLGRRRLRTANGTSGGGLSYRNKGGCGDFCKLEGTPKTAGVQAQPPLPVLPQPRPRRRGRGEGTAGHQAEESTCISAPLKERQSLAAPHSKLASSNSQVSEETWPGGRGSGGDVGRQPWEPPRSVARER
ncbi:translation initiation factor IF-2-like isoform X1 [Orcinus orca]|uniref:translation initiation factor IF-2-like isoform X1 n=1 Tax=Orcinus orca TaxID=9733 RepID=UPI00211293FC|nr:translation initiation factor IF-2-like isoform X1 [Orcinus orca]